jgi:hypothetical protein
VCSASFRLASLSSEALVSESLSARIAADRGAQTQRIRVWQGRDGRDGEEQLVELIISTQ